MVEILCDLFDVSRERGIEIVNQTFGTSDLDVDWEFLTHELPYYHAVGLGLYRVLGCDLNKYDWLKDPKWWPPPEKYGTY